MHLSRPARAAACLAALSFGAFVAELTDRSHPGISDGAAAAVRSVLTVERAHAAALSGGHLQAGPEPIEAVPPPKRPDSTSYPNGLLIEGSTPHRLILFSFDDGPAGRNTALLLDRLDAVGIKALFFLTAGRIAERNSFERDQAALAREIVARGHLVGSHTVDHLQLPLLDDVSASAQILGAERIFQRVLGFHPTLIRPPGGSRSPRVDALLAERGYTTVLWNLGAGDFQVSDPMLVLDTFRKVLDRRERHNGDKGGIVLLHDTYSWSVDAFQLIWAELWARNCKLLERGEELYDIVSDLEFFYQPRAGAAYGTFASAARIPPEVLAQRQAGLRRETAHRCSASDGP
jgi:peptidoglycan/xylan/chitin deacetylase (PgdA/CDA1 family)